MKYTLILENPNGSITAEQLNLFTLNAIDPSVRKPDLSYTYVCQPLESTEERKERAEQDRNLKCPLTRVQLSRGKTLEKSMLMCFSSATAAKQFIQKHKDQDLPFERVLFFSDATVMIEGKHLTFKACRKFKSILITDCDLDEKCVDNILHMASLAEFAKIHQRREETLNRFKDVLSQFCSKSEEERKSAHEHVGNINELAQKLIAEAEMFDKQERRNEATVTLDLGNLFVSFNLREHAIATFNKIGRRHSREYSLAQAQIADLYMTKNAVGWSVDSEVQSLDETPSLDYTNIEKAYLAAHKANQFEQCATSANLLCDFETSAFTCADFTVTEPDNSHDEDRAIKRHTKSFIKACQIIRAQQEEIKRLQKQSAAISGSNASVGITTSTPGSNAAPTVRVYASEDSCEVTQVCALVASSSTSSTSSSSSFNAASSHAASSSSSSDDWYASHEEHKRTLILSTGPSSSKRLLEEAEPAPDLDQALAVQLLTQELDTTPGEGQAALRCHVRRPSSDTP